MLCKSSIQCSVNGWGCVPSLLFNLGPNYGGSNEDNGDLLQKVPCIYCYTQGPQPCSRLPTAHTSTGDSWTLTGKSGSVSCGVTSPFSWVLVHTGSVCALQESGSPVLCKFWWLCGGVNGNLLQEGLCHIQGYCTQSPCPCSSPLLTCTPSGDFLGQTTFSLFNASFTVISKALIFFNLFELLSTVFCSLFFIKQYLYEDTG